LSEDLSDEHLVKMMNPLSADLSVLRQSMLFTGLEVIAYNINRKNQNLKFFEFGNTYSQIEGKRIEQKNLALYITGNRHNDSWIVPNKKSDFFHLKSTVLNILDRLGVNVTDSRPIEGDIFSEGISLRIKNSVIARLGVIKKSVLRHFDIKQEVLYAQMNWESILDLARRNEILVKEITKYPEVKRDLALLLNERTSFKEIYNMAHSTEKKLLKNVTLFDVYTGKSLPKGKKSYAVGFTLQDEKSTLTDTQIDKIMKKLQDRYESELGATLR